MTIIICIVALFALCAIVAWACTRGGSDNTHNPYDGEGW